MSELRDQLLGMKSDLVFNSRLLGHGDCATSEQGAPVVPPEGAWVLCYTINDSWGYQVRDKDHKPLSILIRTFVETISGGGNLLLDVGPRADGTIVPEQESRLKALGAWIDRNEPAVFGTRGIPAGHVFAPTTLSEDRRTLYVFCYDPPRESVTITGLASKVKRITALGTGEELTHCRYGGFDPVPGVLAIDAPSAADQQVTVLAVELDGEIELYRGEGRG